MPKFNHQFFGGLFVGMALATLLALSMAVKRIDATSEFADMNMRLFFAAISDIESLQKACGEPCDNVTLSYPEQMPERYSHSSIKAE